jgi:sRNA-binding protein
MQSDGGDAGAELTRVTQNAVTYTRRVVGTAKARNERHRAENVELIKQYEQRRLAGTATERTPTAVRDAAKKFRSARGLSVPRLPELGEMLPRARPKAAEPSQTGDDDEDFSQERIMSRLD